LTICISLSIDTCCGFEVSSPAYFTVHPLGVDVI